MEQRRSGRSSAAEAQLRPCDPVCSSPCNFTFPLKDVFKNLPSRAAALVGVPQCQFRMGMKLRDNVNAISDGFGETLAQEDRCFGFSFRFTCAETSLGSCCRPCVADCPPWGYRITRQTPLFEVRLCLRCLCRAGYGFAFIDLLSSDQCNPEVVSFSILFGGNAGQFDAVIDLVQRAWKACSRFNVKDLRVMLPSDV